MTIRLLHRKRFRKLTANSKGFSSVIGTTFMVLVIMLLSTSVFLWTLRQNTFYSEAIKEKNQLEVDRLNERVKAFNANYAVEDNNVSVSAELQNQGPLSVQIVNLWVVDVNTGSYNFSSSLSVNYLQPGGNATLTATVTIMGSAPDHRFSSWLITGRGNVVPLEEKEVTEIIRADVAQGIGSIALNFSTFRYYTYDDDDKLANYPSGISSFTIPYKGEIAFGVNLTNLDPSEQPVTLDEYSLLWLYFPGAPGQAQGPIWYVVNVDSNGTISTTYSLITLEWGKSKRLVFASAEPGTFTKVLSSDGGWKQNQKNSIGAVNILTHGEIGSGDQAQDYGQNIPFVAVFVQEQG